MGQKNVNLVLGQWRKWLKKHLSLIIIVMFALQPTMDVFSFWLDRLGLSTAPSLLLRMLVLLATAVIGFTLSKRRNYYWYFAMGCVIFFALHAISCAIAGYISPISDFTNYIRVVQIPLFTMCFITFLRTDSRCFRWIGVGFAAAFAIITVVVLLSVITGTNPHTYTDINVGILGWFSTTNSQASIVSMLTPILLGMAYRSNRDWLFALAVVLTCGQLYFLGTRLAYMAIFASIIGLIFVSAICGHVNKRRYLMMLAAVVVCAGLVKVSPMYRHQLTYAQTMQEKQSDLNVMSANSGVNKQDVENAEEENSKLPLLHTMNQIYCYYRSDLVQRFGVERVMEKCGFSSDVSQITGARKTKIIFCSLLMDEMPETAKFFGMERDAMTYKDQNYDVENDFHGIYFLYGGVGLVLFLAFVAYFIWLIIWALFKNIRKYFTMEAGAYGISFLLALVNAYNTAGILRRPNASFYLSVILAVIFYLVKIRRYPENAGEKSIFARLSWKRLPKRAKAK